jgi:hypothetical protein
MPRMNDIDVMNRLLNSLYKPFTHFSQLAWVVVSLNRSRDGYKYLLPAGSQVWTERRAYTSPVRAGFRSRLTAFILG